MRSNVRHHDCLLESFALEALVGSLTFDLIAV